MSPFERVPALGSHLASVVVVLGLASGCAAIAGPATVVLDVPNPARGEQASERHLYVSRVPNVIGKALGAETCKGLTLDEELVARSLGTTSYRFFSERRAVHELGAVGRAVWAGPWRPDESAHHVPETMSEALALVEPAAARLLAPAIVKGLRELAPGEDLWVAIDVAPGAGGSQLVNVDFGFEAEPDWTGFNVACAGGEELQFRFTRVRGLEIRGDPGVQTTSYEYDGHDYDRLVVFPRPSWSSGTTYGVAGFPVRR